MRLWILLVALAVAGATHTVNADGRAGNAQEQPLQRVLRVISDPGTSQAELDRAVETLGTLQAKEPPGFWVEIVESSKDRAAHRRRAVVEFFRRHVPPALPVDTLIQIPRVATWFDAETLIDMTMASSVPVARSPGSIFMFQPTFVKTDAHPLGVYLRTSEPLSRDEFLDVLSGKKRDVTLTIAEVGIDE